MRHEIQVPRNALHKTFWSFLVEQRYQGSLTPRLSPWGTEDSKHTHACSSHLCRLSSGALCLAWLSWNTLHICSGAADFKFYFLFNYISACVCVMACVHLCRSPLDSMGLELHVVWDTSVLRANLSPLYVQCVLLITESYSPRRAFCCGVLQLQKSWNGTPHFPVRLTSFTIWDRES